ncbi:MAG: FmdB family zinc ribbon protein [Ardenticatenaceae bacterium]
MPIYEYKCPECGKRGSRLQKISDASVPACPHCGATMEKLISRVAVLTSEEQRMERLADPSAWGDFDENDPRSMGRMMRKMGQEIGEDPGDEFREVIERLEAGENPESIEATMPELGMEGPSSGGDWLD